MADKNRSYGYRLHRLEIKNFGGFHGQAKVITLNNESIVLAGENGVGKSTVLDALRVIFRQRPAFNSAKDGASDDRNVSSYYVGRYATKEGGAGNDESMSLRQFGDKKTFMAVLAVFQNGEGEYFSAMRMAFKKSNADTSWRAMTAPDNLSIDALFSSFPTQSQAANVMETYSGTLHGNFDEYINALGREFGLESPEEIQAAFGLIEKSMSLKNLDSVTNFARDNIFPTAFLNRVDQDIVSSFQSISRMQTYAEAGLRKLEALEDMGKLLVNFDAAYASRAAAIRKTKGVGQLKSLIVKIGQAKLYRDKRKQILELEAKIAGLDTERARISEELDSLRSKIEKSGAGRIEILKKERERLDQDLIRTKRTRKDLQERLADIGLIREITTPEVFNEALVVAKQRREAFLGQLAENQSARDQVQHKLFVADAELTAMQDRLSSLKSSKTSVEKNLLTMRSALADHLGLSERELPFLAEIVQIKSGEEDWEGAANRALGGVARQLLISKQHRAEARDFINRHHWNALVQIWEASDDEYEHVSNPQMLSSRLEVDQDSPFAQEAARLIDRHADLACVDIAQFRDFQGDAITKEGSIKRGRRITKDDRGHINDRASYILGWDNSSKIVALEQDIAAKSEDRDTLKRHLDEYEAGLEVLREKRHRADSITVQFQNFDEVDVGKVEVAIRSVEQQLSILLEDKQIEVLYMQKEALERKGKEISTDLVKARDEMSRSTMTRDSSLSGYKREASKEKLPRDLRPEFLALLTESLGETNIFDFASQYTEEVRNFIDREIAPNIETREVVDRRLTRVSSQIDRKAGAILAEFPDLQSNLHNELVPPTPGDEVTLVMKQNRVAWESVLSELQEKNLPEELRRLREERVKESETLVRSLREKADTYRRQVMDLETGLNEILADLPFDPVENTRARIRIKKQKQNLDIIDFSEKLQEADKLIVDDNMAESQLSEIMHEIVTRISEEGGTFERKRRETLMDLRNWYDLEVIEYYVDDNGNETEQRAIYRGKDGASGGQSERLAMLIIGTAMSFTFKSHDSVEGSRGLQLLAIDEAFMHGSDIMATAAVELLDRLGLQVMAATPMAKLNCFGTVADTYYVVWKQKEQTFLTPARISEREDAA